MGLFKTYYHPYTGAVLTNANTKFVCPLTGNDSTGSGTRENPYATLTKAGTVQVLLRGQTNENYAIGAASVLIGDGEDAYVNGTISGAQALNCLNVKILTSQIGAMSGGGTYLKCIVTTFGTKASSIYSSFGIVSNNFITNYQNCRHGILNSTVVTFVNNTISNYFNCLNINTENTIINSIFCSVVDLYNYNSRATVTYIPLFKNCLFRKSVIWKWNSNIIPINWGTYGNAVGDYMADVISAMYAYTGTVTAGTDRTYFSAMFPSASTSNIFFVGDNGQTNKVVDDSVYPIFNKYNGTVPVDYSLKLDSSNIALYMSDTNSYVGCYQANVGGMVFGTIYDVDSNGNNTGNTPDMLVKDTDGSFYASNSSVQIRNRVQTNVLTFPRGFKIAGLQSQLTSGMASRFFFGKFQPYSTTGTPTLPIETVEVIPYDDATTPSAFPRFSASFNDIVQMWYHKYGAGTVSNASGGITVTGVGTAFLTTFQIGQKIYIGGEVRTVSAIGTNTSMTTDAWTTAHSAGSAYSSVPVAKIDTPILFNDLSNYGITTDKSLTEYGAWAVTNADYEYYLLSSKTGVALQNIPIAYLKLELNLNYAV